MKTAVRVLVIVAAVIGFIWGIVGFFGSAAAAGVEAGLGMEGAEQRKEGYIGSNLDMTVQRVVDSVMCIPQLFLMTILITIIGPGILQIIVALGFMWGIVGSRIVRSTVIGIKENMYVAAGAAEGCSTAKITIRHILPNIMAPWMAI